jgi:hypothetical protein
MNRNQTSVELILESIGAEYISFGNGGKHPFVIFIVNGEEFRNSYPSTPSDRRWELNWRSQIKREIQKRMELAH